MLLSKLLQFIVLLASLIASISFGPGSSVAAAENVYTVTPTTNLSPNLQYINTSQLRQKTAKATDLKSPVATPERAVNNEDPVVAQGSVYERKIVREEKEKNEDEYEKLDKSKEALRQLLDRRLIKR